MKLNFATFKDKVNACWIGKNIGGTMGAPYECTHDILDVKGFVTKAGEVLPNDDLDLQLVWLVALEKIGPKAINALTLGEYWISMITPYWNEYGIGKANMRRGLMPPLSGDYENYWNNSNGAWIRSEIWACTAPGSPAVAAKYALEDAKVDHGAGEGTFAAAFVAAMQSAAFVITDVRKCIEIGLAAIPAESRMAKSIKFVMDCYDKGMAPMDTRVAVQEMNADIGTGWFEAPSNVAYAVIGLLWGEGDFKKTMITAINCGDDTDCTAATVGATLGIMYGMAGIPADWHEHLGDGIVTVSIAGGLNPKIPKTCTELTERVVEVAPWMLAANRDLTDVRITECGDAEIPENIGEVMYESAAKVEKVIRELKPFTTNFACPNYSVQVTMEKAPDIEPGGEISFTVTITNNWQGNINEPFNLNLRWMLPEGFSISGGRRAVFMEPYSYRKPPFVTLNFTIKAGEVVNEINRAVLEISAVGRPTIMYIPITLLG